MPLDSRPLGPDQGGMSDESERDFTLRLLQKSLDYVNRMIAATGGRDIRFDVPLGEQFDAATLDALARAMDDDGELEDMLACITPEEQS